MEPCCKKCPKQLISFQWTWNHLVWWPNLKFWGLKHIGWQFWLVLYKSAQCKSELPTNIFIGWLGNSGSCFSPYIWKVSGRGTLVAPWALIPPFLAPLSCTKWGSEAAFTSLLVMFLSISDFQFGVKKWRRCKWINGDVPPDPNLKTDLFPPCLCKQTRTKLCRLLKNVMVSHDVFHTERESICLLHCWSRGRSVHDSPFP